MFIYPRPILLHDKLIIMIRCILILVILVFVGSTYGQSITTTTEYPTTSVQGNVLTAFAFEKYTSNIAGEVDNIYVGDINGKVHTFENGAWSVNDIVQANDDPINDVEESHLGNEPFIATTAGIYENRSEPTIPDVENIHWAFYGIPTSSNHITAVEEDSKGVWLALKDNGLYLTGDTEEHFTTANSPLTTNTITAIGLTFESNNHNRFVVAHGSHVSLYYQGESWENHDFKTSFCDDILPQYIHVDASDGIWVTTNKGLFKYGSSSTFERQEAFGVRSYSHVLATPTGEVWAFEQGVGFHIQKGGQMGFVPVDGINVPSELNDIKFDKGTVKYLSSINHGIMSATYIAGNTDADGDGYSFTADTDDGNPSSGAALEEICSDGIDNNCNGEIDEGCPPNAGGGPMNLVIGQRHPTLDGYIFYLNGTGGGLIVNDEDLTNPEFDNLSMFRWAEPQHLRTETEQEYINFSDWDVTVAHSDQQIIDAYGSSGNYAAMAIREELGSEWRLPTATEAYYIDLNLNQAGLGNFDRGHYWTSSEVPLLSR